MANVLSIVWMVIGMAVFHTSMTVWAALMLPAPVERARRRQQQKPVASFFCGVLFVLVAVLVVSAFSHHAGGMQLLGWAAISPVLLGYIVGSAALARLVAPRVLSEMKNPSPILSLVGGALCTSLAGWFPVIGWFVFAPVTLLINVGSGVLALLVNPKEPAIAPVAAPAPAPVPQPAPVFEFALPGSATSYGEQRPQ